MSRSPVIISSLHALCCLPSVTKQKTLQLCNFTFFIQCIIKQLLDSVFVKSRIIKVSVRVISLIPWLQLITPTSKFDYSGHQKPHPITGIV